MSNTSENNDSINRVFIIGDEWIYYKFYCGVKNADHMIKYFFKSVIDKLIKSGFIDSWFFLRYSDPDFHVRLRLHIPDKQQLSLIINLINKYAKPYFEQGIIWKIQTDTYKREIDRYGDNSIEHIEQIFCFDSMMIMESLNLLTNENDDNLRWKISMIALDSFINCFYSKEEEKSVFCNNQVEYYGKEFGLNHNLRVQLDKKYRDNRNEIEQLLNNKIVEEVIPFSELNQKKLTLCQPIINTLISMLQDVTLKVSLNDLVSSCNHMMFNRIFRTKQRLYEFVMYNMLSKYYESSLARKKYSTNNKYKSLN